jgi:hypothetical protein
VKEHPEDARLTAAGAREVILYTRPGCHLCEEAKVAIAPLMREFGVERYGWEIPVVFIGPRKVAKHRVDVEQFRRQLEESRSR